MFQHLQTFIGTRHPFRTGKRSRETRAVRSPCDTDFDAARAQIVRTPNPRPGARVVEPASGRCRGEADMLVRAAMAPAIGIQEGR